MLFTLTKETAFQAAKLNGANAVSFVKVKHVLENFDNFFANEIVHLRTLRRVKIKYFCQRVLQIKRGQRVGKSSFFRQSKARF